MFPSLSAAIVCLVAIMSWIQLCPAPPLIIVGVEATAEASAATAAAAAADTAAMASASAEAAAAAEEATAVANGFASTDSGIFRKRGSLRRDNAVPSLSTCIADHLSGSKANMTIHSDHTVDISGVPASCMLHIDSYNSHPNISALQAIHGSTVVVGSTAVHLYGIPESAYSYLDAIAGSK